MKALPLQQVEILGEERPDALQDEVANDNDLIRKAFLQAVMQIGNPRHRISRENGLALERRTAASQEGESLYGAQELGRARSRLALGPSLLSGL
ncbi:MAG: hypothetical protein M5T61_20325 [Acidimicrobiia bacterium]|nr:hypothetical protein [Acidimicrobiia bacterium]